jgi:hypothetical protein
LIATARSGYISGVIFTVDGRISAGWGQRFAVVARSASDEAIHPSSFRDGPKDQARNLEIPGSMLRIAPE